MVDGRKIRDLRELEGLSVSELARRMGCGEPVMSSIERNLKTPGVPLLVRIARHFGLPVDDFIKEV